MTREQKDTIARIIFKVQKFWGKQTISIHNIRKNHISLWVGNVRDKVDVITTTTFCNVEINTKGNITKGFVDHLRPKENKQYPYMD